MKILSGVEQKTQDVWRNPGKQVKNDRSRFLRFYSPLARRGNPDTHDSCGESYEGTTIRRDMNQCLGRQIRHHPFPIGGVSLSLECKGCAGVKVCFYGRKHGGSKRRNCREFHGDASIIRINKSILQCVSHS